MTDTAATKAPDITVTSVADITVRHTYGDRFAILIRGHRVAVDQPEEAGGMDEGPTPTELFAASLGACAGFFAERFLRRHDLSVKGLMVKCDFALSEDRPARVVSIDLRLTLLEGFPEALREKLHRVVERYTVHNFIRQAPEVRMELTSAVRAA